MEQHVIPAEAVEEGITAAWIEADLPDEVTREVAERMVKAAIPHLRATK